LPGKKIYTLSDTEVEILRQGIDDPDVTTNYFFRPFGAPKGWKLDENFELPGQWQKACHQASQRRIIIIGGFGTGKAQPLDAKLLTPSGWMNMGDARIDDEVIGSDGKPHKIVGVYPQGEQDIFLLTFSDSSKAECTNDHLWAFETNKTRQRNLPRRILSLADVRENLFRQNGKKYKVARYFIPIVRPVEFYQKTSLPLDPYLLGLLIGDGGLSNEGVRFSTKDQELVSYIADHIPPEVSIKYISQNDYYVGVGNRSGFGRNKNPLIAALTELGLFGSKSNSKFIPEIYKRASPSDRLSLLQGLFDTDGCPSLSAVEFCTVSRELAYGVVELVQSLGGRATLSRKTPSYIYRGKKRNGQIAYRLYVKMPDGFLPFRLKRKLERYSEKRQHGPMRALVNIEFSGRKKAQCIHVDSPDGLYVTDDYILTHNTKGVGVMASTWCMITKDFSFMNCAPLSWQSELMYKFIINVLARNTPFGKLIYSQPRRPYPTIELRFFVGGSLISSTMEFMSVDKNANAILSWEGDWVNIDEAGQVDDLETTIRNLGSRMRGSINGRERLGRMSMTSNSWENPEMWYRYDLARELPKDYLSMTVSSRYNKNITPDQLRLMLKDIPEDEHERFIDGSRPEGLGNYFSKTKVYACEDTGYNGFITGGIDAGLPGFALESVHGAGVVYFTVPRAEGHIYILVGDPGTGNTPNRNAPAIQVWDVTDFPKNKAIMTALYWGSGNGSITPFIRAFLSFMQMYNPVKSLVDNTGTQKSTAELLNLYIKSTRTDPEKRQDWLGDVDLSKVLDPTIYGLDFSGGRKPTYLIAGRLVLEAGLAAWPKFAVGMRSQLTNYDPDKDRAMSGPKIAQDLVAAYCMAAHTVCALFAIDPQELVSGPQPEADALASGLFGREARLTTEDRQVVDARVAR
jgi:hypothetical protein